MATQVSLHDWTVTAEKVEAAVRALVEACDPLQVIAFGSRARGDHREDSDLDLAVVIKRDVTNHDYDLAYKSIRFIRMEVSVIVVSQAKYDLYRPWRNSVFCYIDREGVVLYDRQHPESIRTDALYLGEQRRVDTSISIR